MATACSGPRRDTADLSASCGGAIPAGIVAVAAILIVAAFFHPFRLIAAFPIDPGKVSLVGHQDRHGAAAAHRIHP